MVDYILPLRAVQAVFTIIVLGLSAYIISEYLYSPDSVNFMLFTTIWTLLATAYLVVAPLKFPQIAHKYMIAAVEAVTMIFWFGAWVAVAVYCSDRRYLGWHGSVWSAGVAATVFGVFIWLSFVGTLALAVLHIRRTPRNDTSAPPEMQQGV